MVVKRRYESARRQQQAQQTRRAILDAAAELFVEPGYAATALTTIAARAGVAIQTLYAVFGSKRQLLSALVDVTIAGDDDPVAIADRPFVAEIAALPDATAKLVRYAEHLAEVSARNVQVMIALANAATADADAAAIWQKNIDERRFAMTMFAAELATTGSLRSEYTVESVADVLWLAMDIRNYDWLVRQRGWTTERYQRWYVDTVAGAILEPGKLKRPPVPPKRRGPA